MKHGHKGYTQHHHCQRQTKVVLHKTHPIGIGLTGSREKGNGAGLGTHDGEQNQKPAHGIVTLKITAQVLLVRAFINAISNYRK